MSKRGYVEKKMIDDTDPSNSEEAVFICGHCLKEHHMPENDGPKKCLQCGAEFNVNHKSGYYEENMDFEKERELAHQHILARLRGEEPESA